MPCIGLPELAEPSSANRISDGYDGGIRRDSELPQQEEIAVPPTLFEKEFDDGPEEPDAEAVQVNAMSRSMQGIDRTVSVDPDDGMGL